MKARELNTAAKEGKGIFRVATGWQWSSHSLGVVFRKELADHLRSPRFTILFLLIAVTGIASAYVAGQTIRTTVGQEAGDFVFLRLFTTSGNSLPPFTSFLSFLGPLVGLGLAFDAINGEHNSGTLSRLLAQPLYRDDVINGKFLAGISLLGMMLLALGFVVAGLGLVMIGVPPTTEEVGRLLLYLALTVVYIAFWLSVSLLFSIVFRQAATSALAGIGLWLFFAIFAQLLAGAIANAVFPVTDQSPPEEVLRNVIWEQGLSRLSPSVLYGEAAATLLSPGVRTLGPVMLEQVAGAIPGTLPLGQSVLLVWPHLAGLVAATLIIFALAYYLFLRQEIRA